MKKDNLEIDNKKGAFGPFFLSLEQVKPYLLETTLSDAKMAELIKEMSEKFTTKRDKIKDYVLNTAHVSAYTSLYLTTNIPKLNFVLSKLPESIVEDIFERPFIDIGCGPGTFSLGMCLESNGKLKEVHCVDTSDLMLKQSEKIIKGMFPEVNLHVSKDYLSENRNSVLFFGHSINEMGIDSALNKINRVNPEYLIYIEPATSQFFNEIKQLRSRLVENYDIVYPCPSINACPNDWCHQVLRTSHEQSVERLSQLVSLDRKILPLVAHVYVRKNKLNLNSQKVITRYLNETKFSFEYEVCIEQNGQNKILNIEIQKRDLSKKEEKSLKNFNVGEIIDFEIAKVLENKSRVKLINFNPDKGQHLLK